MANWKTFLVRLAFGIGAVALGAYLLGLVGFVVAVPILAFAISKPLIEMTHDGFTWTSNQPLTKWQGHYYEFNDVQIRVLEDGDKLWFSADDMIKATQIEAKGATLLETKVIEDVGPCLPMDGVEKVLLRHRSHESQRFLLWARREVQTPWERKRSGALVPD
jgi:hypothetical protein